MCSQYFKAKRWAEMRWWPLKEAVKSVATASVESGATSNKGRGGNCKPASPISLHTVPWERSKKTKATGRHPFCWKKGSQGGRTSQGFTLVYRFPKNATAPPLEKSPKWAQMTVVGENAANISRGFIICHRFTQCQHLSSFPHSTGVGQPSHDVGVGQRVVSGPTAPTRDLSPFIMDKVFKCASGTRCSLLEVICILFFWHYNRKWYEGEIIIIDWICQHRHLYIYGIYNILHYVHDHYVCIW